MEGSTGAPRAVGVSRLVVGALQGVMLWLVFRQADLHHPGWLANHPRLFSGLILMIGFTPVVLLAGLGQMRRWTLIALAVATAAATSGIGAYADWRKAIDSHDPWPQPPVLLMTAAALFIAHHLVAASDEHRRLRAPYPAYFDIA